MPDAAAATPRWRGDAAHSASVDDRGLMLPRRERVGGVGFGRWAISLLLDKDGRFLRLPLLPLMIAISRGDGLDCRGAGELAE